MSASCLLKSFAFVLFLISAVASAQEGGGPAGECLFKYSSSPFASLVGGSVQVTSNVQFIDFSEGLAGSHDTASRLPLCEKGKGCVVLAGVPLYFPKDPLKNREWKFSGYRYVVGTAFSDVSRGALSVIPVYVYALKAGEADPLAFQAIFFIDSGMNLLGYTFWMSSAMFGDSPVRLLSSYWLVGDRAPLSCIQTGKVDPKK